MLMHKNSGLQKRSFKKVWVIISCITAVILIFFGAFLGKSFYDTYHDRPLANGLQYLGRNYNSPCYLGQCYGPTSEAYYYGTNVKPEDIVDLFPGWKIDKTGTTDETIWDSNDESNITYYNLVNTKTGKESSYEYIANKQVAMQAGHLLANDKKYIIRIWSDDSNGYNNYAALR